MKASVSTSDLRNYNLVATYNADPFAVEYDEQMAEVIGALGEYADRYDKSDDKFTELAEKLDGNVDTYKHIYTNNFVTVGVL